MHRRALVFLCVAAALVGCGSDGGSGPTAAALHLVPPADTIGVGETTQLRAVVLDGAGDTLRDETVVWLATPTSVATVSSTGLVRGMSGGYASVTASVQGAADNAVIFVAVPGASITIQGVPADSLWPGGTVQLSAIVRGPAGEVPNTDTAVTWTSNDTTIASVSPSGVVTARYGGSTVIAAATPRAATSVTIPIRFPVHRVTVSPDTLTILPGDSTRLTATLTDTNGVTITDRPLTWASSDPSVATVTPFGVVRALEVGEAWIRVSSESRIDSARTAVTRLVLGSVGAGWFDACGLSVDSLAYCWGQRGHPYKIATPPRPAALFVGRHDLCANTADSTTICWQYDYAGAAPIVIPGNRRLRHVSIEATICGIAGDSTAWCWIGNGTVVGPRQVAGGLRFNDIATAPLIACGLAVGGVAYCWQGLGDGDSGSATAPAPVPGAPVSAAIVAGSAFACGLDLQEAAWCWDVSGQTLFQVPGGHRFIALDAEFDRVCGITSSRAAYCWGGASPGYVPYLVPDGPTWLTLSVGEHLACGLAADGAYCWGQASAVPIKVPGQD